MGTRGGIPARRSTCPRSGGEGPVLRGVGRFADRIFPLHRPRLTVGRVAPAEILLDDDSVSRRHAEIVGSGRSVRDLGSANGTFVNGERVHEAVLAPGDVLRFGEVELCFSAPDAARPATRRKGRWLLGVGGASALLLTVAAAGVLANGPAQPLAAEEERLPAARAPEDPLRLMGMCMAFSDPESWEHQADRCLETCGRVHELDPSLGAGARAKACQREKDDDARVEAAGAFIGTGLEEEGLKRLAEIGRDSFAFLRAKARFDEAAGILLKRYRFQCQGEVSGGRFAEAQAGSCRRALELSCNRPEGPDLDVLRWFRQAAQQAGKGPGEYLCPPLYAVFQNPLGRRLEAPGKEAEAAIRAKYPNARVAEAMVEYLHGKPRQAATMLKKARAQAAPEEGSRFGDLILWVDLVDGKVSVASGFLRLGSLEEADGVLKDVFDADSKLMPPGVEGESVRGARADLAKLFGEKAGEACRREHYSQCAELLARGRELGPESPGSRLLQLRLDREAARLLGSRRYCEEVASALSLTPVGSPLHDKALDLGQRMGCR